MAGVKLTGPAFPFLAPYTARFSYGGRFFWMNRSQDSANLYYPRVYEIVGDVYVERPYANTADITSFVVEGCAVSSDGLYFACMQSAGDQMRVFKWDGSAYQLHGTYSLGTGFGRSVIDFTYDDQFIAAGGYGGVRIKSVSGGSFLDYAFIDTSPAMMNSMTIEDCKFSPDGQFLALSGRDRVQLYYVGTSTPVRLYNVGDNAWGVSWSQGSRKFFGARTVTSTGGSAYTISGSGSGATVTPSSQNSSIPSGSWNQQEAGAWLKLEGTEYLICGAVNGGTSAFSVIETSGFTATSKTLADFEITGMTGNGGASCDSAFSSDGTQVFLSDRGPNGLQLWKLSTEIKASGTVDLPFDDTFGALQLGNVPVDTVPALRFVTYYVDVASGGEKIVTSDPMQFLYETSDLPAIEAGGYITPGIGIIGDSDLPLTETSGVVSRLVDIEAAVDLPAIEADGEVFSGLLIEEATDLPRIETDGSVFQDFILNGATDLPGMDTSGYVFRGSIINGDLIGKKPISSGRLGSIRVFANLTGKLPVSDGSLVNAILFDGELKGLLPTSEGVVAMPYDIEAALIGLLPTSAGKLELAYSVDAIMKGKAPTGAGQLKYSQSLGGELTGKLPVGDGELRAARFLVADLIGKLPSGDGLLRSGLMYRGQLVGKLPTGSGELVILPKINGELMGKLPSGDGYLFYGYRVTVDMKGLKPTGNGLVRTGSVVRGVLIGRLPTGDGKLALPPTVNGHLVGKLPISDGFLELITKYPRWFSIID